MIINRHEFLKILIILSVGIVLAACEGGTVSTPIATEKQATATFQVTDTPTQIPTVEPTETMEETQEPTSEMGITIDPENPYNVRLSAITTDDLLAKSNDELITLAPEIYPTDYLLEGVNTLGPLSVARVTDKEKPFVIYVDDNGAERMIWDVEDGDILYSSVSVDVDTLGIPVRFHLATNHSWIEQFGEYLTLDEKEEGAIARLYATYPFALNNFYTNHEARFAELTKSRRQLRMDFATHLIVDEFSQAEIDNMNSEALNTLRADIADTIQNQNELKLKLGRMGKTVLDENMLYGFDIFMTLEFGHRIAKRSYEITPFKDHGWFNSFGGKNNALVEVKTDDWWSENVLVFYPGGLLAGYLRETTAIGGYSYRVASQYRTLRGTTDGLIYDLCGRDAVSSYMNHVGGEFFTRNVVPTFDAWEDKQVPSEVQYCSLKRVGVE